MAGMKQLLLMIAVVALVGCGKDKPQEESLTPEFNTENIVQGANAPPCPPAKVSKWKPQKLRQPQRLKLPQKPRQRI